MNNNVLRLHFLNVGKGDCTIVEFPSQRLGMIDIDDSRSFEEETFEEIAEEMGWKARYNFFKTVDVQSARRMIMAEYKIPLTDPVQYYLENFKYRSIFRFIVTHPDMDHLSGLHRLWVENGVTICNFWDTNHRKDLSDDDWEKSPYDKSDWDTYQALRCRNDNPKVLKLLRGETADCCWVQDGIEILSPTSELEELAKEKDNYNHLSYVLSIKYGGRRIILGGDATLEAWENILNYYGASALKADILKAPHHGSISCFHKEAMEAINPDHTIVSVGRKIPYAYDDYKKFGRVYSTKWYGNIIVDCYADGKIIITPQFERE